MSFFAKEKGGDTGEYYSDCDGLVTTMKNVNLRGNPVKTNRTRSTSLDYPQSGK
jgi:hypothetical protein